MNSNDLWKLFISVKLTDEQVDKFSMEEIKCLDDHLTMYFAQMGHCVSFAGPFGHNYQKVSPKIKKLKL